MKKSIKKKKRFLRNLSIKVLKLKRYLSSWGKYFSYRLNQKFTLIFFSKEGQKSVVKEWGTKRIFSTVALLVIMVFLSIHYVITNEPREQNLSHVKEENLKLDSQIEKLEARVDIINSHQKKYDEQMLKIYRHFGDIEGRSVWEKASRNKDVELIRNTWKLDDSDWLNTSDRKSFTALEKINQSRIQLLLNINQLKEIDQYMNLVDKIADNIPTGWPIKNNIGYKTSGFGTRLSPFMERREFHTGIDIAAAPGNDLLATADGVVLFSGDKGAFGQVIIIRHDFGYRTIYAHNRINLVKSGQRVKKNQKIAEVGNTGRSTGSHVHYEIRIGTQYVDPWPYILAKF